MVGLDYRDAELSVHDLLQELKTHPRVRRMLEGGERIAWGAKTIPEGGYLAVPRRLHAPGLLICGDGAGLVNVPALKGIHYAVESGRLAAEAAFGALARGEVSGRIGSRPRTTMPSGRASSGRTWRRPQHAPGLRPRLLARRRDGRDVDGEHGALPAARREARARRGARAHSDRPRAVLPGSRRRRSPSTSSRRCSLEGNQTRDDQPSHIRIRQRVPIEVAELWVRMCPAHVYEADEGGGGGDGVELRPVRRDHCQGRTADAAGGRLRARVHGDVTVEDVLAARDTIAGRLHRTPMLTSATLSELTGARVHLKAELFQKTGSFKTRGVLTKLAALTPEQRARGVISISAGNHAQALAYGARTEGIDALVVMWRGASEAKIEATRAYGAEVDLETDGPAEAFERLDELQEQTGRTLVHPFDDPLTIAGQGTVGLEIVEDVPTSTCSSFRSAAAASSPGSQLRRRAGASSVSSPSSRGRCTRPSPRESRSW